MISKIKVVLILSLILSKAVATTTIPVLTEKDIIDNHVWQVATIITDPSFFHMYTSILWNESRYKHGSINYNTDGTYDYGIAQLNSKSFDPAKRHFGFNPTNRYENVSVGARYYLTLVKQYNGDYYRATLAYNCGPNNVARNSIPNVTRIYCARVMLRAFLSECFYKYKSVLNAKMAER